MWVFTKKKRGRRINPVAPGYSSFMERDEPCPVVERLAQTSPEASRWSASRKEDELRRRGLVAAMVAGCALAIQGCLEGEGVAVVGARSSDPYGLAVARQLGRDLGVAGFTVISGGAEGCDAAAHEGALEVGGRTVVVLPAGHDHPYPTRHRGLFSRAAERGAVVSPFWPTVNVSRSRFLTRNRVIAALARAVVVVRAQARSGSLSTAAAAKALGRPLGAVVGPIGDALSEGCHHLLDDGAVPICSRSGLGRWLGQVVGHELGWPKRPWPTRPAGLPAPWDDVGEGTGIGGRDGPAGVYGQLGNDPGTPLAEAQMAKVMAIIGAEPGLDLDTIAVRSAVPFENLIGCLLDLEMRGGLERLPGGRYRTTGRGV